MKKLLLPILFAAAAALAAPGDYSSQRASGTTSASVIFEPSPNYAQLVVADVTSDKAASVLSWQLGNTNVTILAAALSTDTNLYTTVAVIATNSSLVSVTAAGVVTAHNAWTNSLFTNGIVVLENSIGTNVPTNSIVREVTTTNFLITAYSSTNVVTCLSNNFLAVGTNLLFEGMPGQVITNQVVSWVTNGANLDITLSNNFSFVYQTAYLLSPTIYQVPIPALATDTSLILTNCTGLIPTDKIVILPSSGGASLRQIQSTNTFRWQLTPIKAATGVALATGDRVFVLDTSYTTPVGAATVRLFGTPIRVLPPGVPGVLTVDGTSAVSINAAVVKYK